MNTNKAELLRHLQAARDCVVKEVAKKRAAYDKLFDAATLPAATRSTPDCSAELALLTAATILKEAEQLEFQIAESIEMAAQMTYDECLTGTP